VTDSAKTSQFEPTVADGGQSVDASAAGSWLPSPRDSAASSPAERPEVLVGAAFAGGLVLAMILKRLAN
jgi:hypothetical protein